MFDSDSDLPWERDENESHSVILVTSGKLHLAVRPIDSIHATEEQVAVEVLLVNPSDPGDQHRIAQQILPAGGEQVLSKFLAEPVQVALIAKEGGPGVEGQLVALVSDDRIRAVRAEDEPWLASVDTFEDRNDGEASPVFLGKIVRYEKDRKHPGDLSSEAADVLGKVLLGTGKTLVDKILESL